MEKLSDEKLQRLPEDEEQLQHTPQAASSDVAPQPADGGTEAWSRVLGCFFVFFITWGIPSTFGAYQAYYQVDLLRTYSPSTISWIGTVQVSLLGLTGLIAGPLYDRGYIRWELIGGCFLVTFGLMMLSISTKFWHAILCQGVCIGLGNGFLYIPSLSIVANSFTKRRPIAIGIASCGSAIGGIVLPIMFRHLEPTIGFGWVNRIFGFIVLVLAVAAILLLRPDPNYVRARGNPLFDPTALREPPYLILAAGLFFVFLGYWVPLFFLVPFAQLSLRTSNDYAFYLLAILNAGSLAGRIFPALLAQLIGPSATLAMGALSLGILILAWIGISSAPGITVWAVLVGFMSGLNVALPSAVIPQMSPSREVVGARTGMAWSAAAFAALIGSPIAGALVDTKTNDYMHGQVFGGIATTLGGLLLIYPAVHITRRLKVQRQ